MQPFFVFLYSEFFSSIVDTLSIVIGFKIFFGCTAKRAGPILREILVVGTGLDTVINIALMGLINISAKLTNVIHINPPFNFCRYLFSNIYNNTTLRYCQEKISGFSNFCILVLNSTRFFIQYVYFAIGFWLFSAARSTFFR